MGATSRQVLTVPATLPSRGYAVVFLGLASVTVLAWIYLIRGAGLQMNEMDMGGGQVMATPPIWTPGYAAAVFIMWAVMMAAMMLPSATPAVLATADRAAIADDESNGSPAAIFFAAGYLAIWMGFSLAATLVQWMLDRAGLLSPSMATRSGSISVLILLAAGLYQLTPLKRTCLEHCYSSLECVGASRNGGGIPNFKAGIRYGRFCLGCCWMLMGLLFVGGLMNLYWIAALAMLVFVEKTVPWGGRTARLAGIGLIAWATVATARGI
jgi:predicted metal-binding membrane protein